MDGQHSSTATIANPLLPLRLNAEPAIFRGCSLSELTALAISGCVSFIPLSIFVCGLFGYWAMGIGFGVLLVIAWIVAGATLLQRLKRGRPQGYYQLRLRLWLEDWRLVRRLFIRTSQVWDIGRRVKA